MTQEQPASRDERGERRTLVQPCSPGTSAAEPYEDDRLAIDDAGIEQAAIALAYVQRPVVLNDSQSLDPVTWWQIMTERERRLFLVRARATVSAWESYWSEIERARNAA